MTLLCTQFEIGFTVGACYRIELTSNGFAVTNDDGEQVLLTDIKVNF